jgi:hypothetical protein
MVDFNALANAVASNQNIGYNATQSTPAVTRTIEFSPTFSATNTITNTLAQNAAKEVKNLATELQTRNTELKVLTEQTKLPSIKEFTLTVDDMLENSLNTINLIDQSIASAARNIESITTEAILQRNPSLKEIETIQMESLDALALIDALKDTTNADISKLSGTLKSIALTVAMNDQTWLKQQDLSTILNEGLKIGSLTYTPEEIQTNTTLKATLLNNISKTSEMAYKVEDITKDEGLNRYLRSLGYISNVEEFQGAVASKKEINGVTLFEAMRNYQKESGSTNVLKPVLMDVARGPISIEIIQSEEPIQRKATRTIKFDEPTQLSGSQIKKVSTDTLKPIPTENGTYKAQLTDPTGKVTTLRFDSLSDAQTQMAIWESQNPESRRRLSEIVPGKNAVTLVATLTRYNNEGKKIEKNTALRATGSTIEEAQKKLNSTLEKQIESDTNKGIKIVNVEMKTYHKETFDENLIMAVGGTETPLHAANNVATPSKQSLTGSGELLYSAEKQAEIAEAIAKQEQTFANTEYVRLLEPGETILSEETKQQILAEKEKYPYKFVDNSITVIKQDIAPAEYVNIEGHETISGILNAIYKWYLPDNEKLAADGILQKSTVTQYGASFMDVYGQGTRSMDAATALTLARGPVVTTTEYKLTELGEQVRQEIVAKKQSGDIYLTSKILDLDENDQNNLVYGLEFANDDIQLEQMKTDIKNMPAVELARISNTWYGSTAKEVVGEEAFGDAWLDEDVIASIAQIHSGQTVPKLEKIISEITSPYMTGDVTTDFAAFFLLGGVAGEIPDIFNVASKLGKTELVSGALLKVADISKSVDKVGEFVDYAKNAKIEIPYSVINNAVFNAMPISNIAIIPSSGSISKAISSPGMTADIAKLGTTTTNKVDAKITTIVQDYRKTLDAGMSNDAKAAELVLRLAGDDKTIVNAALTEFIGTDPNTIYAVISKGSTKVDPATATTVWERLETANKSYSDLAEAFVKDIITKSDGDPIVAAKQLTDMGDNIGKDAVNYMINTAMAQGTNYYNDITNAVEEWSKIDNAATPILASPTGATKAISSKSIDLDVITPDQPWKLNALRRDSNKVETSTGKVRKIEDVHDLAALSDEEIVAISNSDYKFGITIQDLRNYRTKAQDILSRDVNAEIEDVTEKLTAADRIGDTVKETAYKKPKSEAILIDMDRLGFKPINMENWRTGDKTWSWDAKSMNTLSDKDFKYLTERNQNELAVVFRDITIQDIMKAPITNERKSTLIRNFATSMTSNNAGITKIADATRLNELVAKQNNEITKLMSMTDNMEIKKQQELIKSINEEITLEKNSLEVAKSHVDTTPKIPKPSPMKPGKTAPSKAANNALNELKKGNIDAAAKKLGEASTYKRQNLMADKANLPKYDGVTIAKIRRLEGTGAPDSLIKQMMRERSEYALQQLAKQDTDMKKIAFKLSKGDELTEAERLKLWDNGDDIRKLGKDAAHTDDGNLLIKGLTDDAIKSGDKARMQKLADEIKADKENCVKLGECAGTSAISSTLSSALSSTPVLALGVLTAAGLTMTTMTDADGKMWKYDADKETYYEITQNGPKTVDVKHSLEESTEGPENVNVAILPAWKALMNSEIPLQSWYEGSTPGYQGRNVDMDEYICQNFALDAVDVINSDTDTKKANLKAYVVNIYGTITTDKTDIVSHALVMIENGNKKVGSYVDPVTKRSVPIYEKTLIEPQTGQTSYSGIDLTSTNMMLGSETYDIELIQQMENTTQELRIGYDTGIEDISTVSKGDMITNVQDEYAPGISQTVREAVDRGTPTEIAEQARISPWWSEGTDKKIVPKK